MRRLACIPGVFVLMFWATWAFCQSSRAEDAITEEEYGIYLRALQKIGRASSIDIETLDGVKFDIEDLMMDPGVRPDGELVQDFNAKNINKYQLSESFVREAGRSPGFGREGSKMVTFSRIGFDRQKQRALLLAGSTFYQVKDIMNEAEFLLLEKKDGRWKVQNTITAWRMRLGKIR
jgi:hypothetical protein